jgi:hypothetical protein
LSDASTASDPPETKYTCPSPCGARDEIIGEFLGDLRREERRMRIWQLLRLTLDRADDALIAVTETRHGRTAASIDVALACGVNDLDAVARDGDRQLQFRHSMKDCGHATSVRKQGNGARRQAPSQRARNTPTDARVLDFRPLSNRRRVLTGSTRRPSGGVIASLSS